MAAPLTVVLVANTNGRLAIPALAGLLVLHDYCTQTYINLHKLFTLHCNFICVLPVVIIKTDDDDDDDYYLFVAAGETTRKKAPLLFYASLMTSILQLMTTK